MIAHAGEEVFRIMNMKEIHVDRMLNIAEVAALYQISTRTLRYYEEVGILKSHGKTDSRYREYNSERCKPLEIILFLRRLSFSIKAV